MAVGMFASIGVAMGAFRRGAILKQRIKRFGLERHGVALPNNLAVANNHRKGNTDDLQVIGKAIVKVVCLSVGRRNALLGEEFLQLLGILVAFDINTDEADIFALVAFPQFFHVGNRSDARPTPRG